jgi:KipI family sensor histidine kinase inhibitor
MIEATAAGDTGLLLDTDLPPAWLAGAIERARLPGVVDVIPGATTVLVLTEPGTADRAGLAATIAALPVAEPPASATSVVEIPVHYDGPDLDDVARLSGLSVAAVIEAHAAGLYTVGWLGFCPGFGYLTGLDQRLKGVPRLDTPRRSVPAGSVAIAAGLAAVYPTASPGGWRLLGRTTVRMWDPDRDPAALLAPGRHVRFVPASEREVGRSPRAGGAAPERAAAVGAAAPCLEVIKPGPLATVQDLGRLGQGSVGVPPSGAADPVSLIAANRLVGNPDDLACVELTLGRAAFRCHGDLSLAVAGAPAAVTVDAGAGDGPVPVEFGARFFAADGAVVSVGAPPAGLRCYVAVAGGLAVPVVLGSRSSDLLSGLGGGPLQPGAVLPVGAPARVGPDAAAARSGVVPRTGTQVIGRGEVAKLRVIAGPRLDWFAADALDRLCAGIYTVTPTSNRTGLRLDGEPLRRSSDAELPSEGLVTGSLQVPPAGLPILHLADHPTVGGYPVIAVVASADIGQAAQLRPGDKLSFTQSAL